MIQDIFGKCKDSFKITINKLKGCDRRNALAALAIDIGRSGQSYVSKEFKISRDTIRKGINEIKSGVEIKDNFSQRGRKKIESKLPKLLDDIKEIVDLESQTDPTFHSTRLFTRLTVKEIRNQLIEKKSYTDIELPTNSTLNTKVNNLGYKLTKVKKTRPLKKIEQTDDIFNNLKKVHAENSNKENVVRISIDAKDKVKIGNFSRGGYNRFEVKANDHDFCSEHITPFGVLDVKNENIHISLTKEKVTADFIVDQIESYWINSGNAYNKDTLIINADNGPENSSRRTQYIKRIVEFSLKYKLKVILAYYPPYHSKYNPIERVWGVLEKHWNGSILDSSKTVLEYIKNMTWKRKTPNVEIKNEVYKTGKKVEKKIMKKYENILERGIGIEKWFVIIDPDKCKDIL